MKNEQVDQVLIALRRIIRAIDLHSKKLVQQYGVTGPQAMILKRIIEYAEVPTGILAREVNLSQATVTSILDRLERQDYIQRIPSQDDKRKVLVRATPAAVKIFENAPPLLQEEFIRAYQQLENWEQNQILSTLQRIASMMDAKEIDASPLLATRDITE
ncbi:MAG: MarR family winged helix-turn-helix transcriptional regulator [Gammaproteobacteria bacterium]